MIVGRNGKIVFANEYFSHNLDWDMYDLIGQSVGLLFSKATQMFCECYVVPTVLKEGRCCEVQLSLLSASGATVPKVASVRQLPNGNLAWVFLEAEQRTRLFNELENARQALQEQREQLERLARTDPLTGLANRREFDNAGQAVILRARRTGQPVTVLMLDVDHLKIFNDTHGHEAGDRVLSALAGVLKAVCRESDIVARLGGDEFACVLSDTGLSDAKALVDRLRMALKQTDCPAGKFTVSIGLAERTKISGLELHELTKQADNAMYGTKQKRRDATIMQ